LGTAALAEAGDFEPDLGNPAVDDYVLSSKANGTRSWVEMGGGATAFVDLSDTPASITANRLLRGNGAGDALEFAAVATSVSGGVATISAMLTADRTYTLPNSAGTIALTADLAAYLPLAGGTMTGNMTLNTGVEIRATSGQPLILSGRGGSASQVRVTNESGFAPTLNITGSGTATFQIQGATAMTASNSNQVNIGAGFDAIVFSKNVQSIISSAATNSTVNHFQRYTRTTGTAAAGLGINRQFFSHTSTGFDREQARIETRWHEATDASRKADYVLSVFDTAQREAVRYRADGSGASIGFYGVAPVARQLLATGVGATADDIITALQNLGLVRQS